MAIFQLPSSLAKFTEQQREIEIVADTFQGALPKLMEKFPQLKLHTMDEYENLLPHVAIFIDDEHIENTKKFIDIGPHSQIQLVLALSGG